MSKTVNNKHISIFTFHLTTTNRNITFFTKKRPNNIQCEDSAEARTCYIFKITNISDSVFQYMVSRLSIFKETNRQIDTDRPTRRWAERQTGKETVRQAGRQAEMQTARETDK